MTRRDTNENLRQRGPRAESDVRIAIRRAVSDTVSVLTPSASRGAQDVRRSA